MSAPPLDAAAREAIDWMVQLHSGEASARDRQAFEAWLRRDARHEPIRPMPTLPSHPSALRRGLRPAVLAGAAPLAAHAQSGVDAAERACDIPPQALGASLTRIAEESGERISIDSESVRGLSASPVRGRYTAEQAARKALEDSGLQLSRTGNGTLTVRRAEAARAPAAALAAPAALPGVTISGKAPGATTEGTGAYETNSSSSSTRINLSPQETPQSLTVVSRASGWTTSAAPTSATCRRASPASSSPATAWGRRATASGRAGSRSRTTRWTAFRPRPC
nr:DUF4880 domain-containing protein [Alicycliphilus denitrificans]